MTSVSLRKQLNTISLFSGGGGMDLGFGAAGYNIVCSADIDEYSCNTLRINSTKKPFLNHGKVIQEDIVDMQAETLLHSAGLRDSQIALVIGGPPCQAFSVFGRRKGLDDPRGNLVWEFLRLVSEIRPQAFVFENVSGLRTIHNGTLFDEMKEALSLNGAYTVSVHEYDMADYGIPQFRRRIFFLGHNGGNEIPAMIATHGTSDLFQTRRPFVTVRRALDYMPTPGRNSVLPNHIGRRHSQRIIDRYRSLAFGERDPKTRINKLHPDRPSYTIIVGSDAGGGKGHVHPFEPREVTPRESARLQTFPDWWEFYGTGRHVIRQVGNAVPPLFAALLAEHMKRHVFGISSELTYDDFLEILELDFLKATSDSRSVQSQDPF